MTKLITGLHHITALTSDAQQCVNFYAGILGLRLVKKTVNFDAPDVYHLYFGDTRGSPGTILTFFPFPGMPRGRKGKGQLTVTAFSIPEDALDYWIARLDSFNIPHQEPYQRFEETVIYFEDYDGLGLELVANQKDARPGFTYGHIPAEYAIRGFYGMTLTEESKEKTASLLVDQMDHQLIAEKDNRSRYSTGDHPGQIVDIECHPDARGGRGGAGTVHHVAFATANEATQLTARNKLIQSGLDVTPVLDRQYFHSIYFREPGGVLFEIATVLPGFTVDEPIEHLGESLKLPPWEEPYRQQIEKALSSIKINIKEFENK